MDTLAFMVNFAVDMVSVWWPVLIPLAVVMVVLSYSEVK